VGVSADNDPIVVWGAGAIGGAIGAFLFALGMMSYSSIKMWRM